MVERKTFYKCNHCGLIIEIEVGGAHPVCCGDPMELMTENTVDAAKEKHVPVIEEIEGGIKVKVGEVEHPMVDDHYIAFISVTAKNGIIYKKELKSGDKPEAEFPVSKSDVEKVVELCNKHGLWKA